MFSVHTERGVRSFPVILHDRNQLKLGEQSRAAERFTWSEFQPIPAKGADLRLMWSPVVMANSLVVELSMSGKLTSTKFYSFSGGSKKAIHFFYIF